MKKDRRGIKPASKPSGDGCVECLASPVLTVLARDSRAADGNARSRTIGIEWVAGFLIEVDGGIRPRR
jgi:hypothetical protein